MITPSETEGNGRATNGRFGSGNTCAKGNPFAKKIGQLRAALIRAVSEGDIEAIVRKLVEQARAGDIHAAREVLLRTLGKPQEADLLERLEELEGKLEPQARAQTPLWATRS